jgi:hypothetical protein
MDLGADVMGVFEDFIEGELYNNAVENVPYWSILDDIVFVYLL